MKPTVINNSSEPSNPVQHEPAHQQHQNMDNSTTNNGQNPANNEHSRRFPQFRQHGFGFNDPDDDVFANMGLRSRLNRMGNPFEWSARKRQNGNDPYEHYFRDEVDFPHFGSTWDAFNRIGNKRSQHPSEVNDRSGFFDYLPAEFRQYMPESFGQFDSRRQPAQHQGQQHQGQHPGPHSGQHPGQHPGQHQYVPQHEPSTTQQSNSKTNLCDASIQTDDLTSNQRTENNGNAAPNENKSSQNQPNNGYNRSAASSSSTSTPYGNQVHMSTSAEGPGAHASASARNNENQYYQQSPQYEDSYGRQYQQHPYAQHYSPQPEAQPNQHAHPQQSTQTTQGVRHVPIFFEGSNKPVNRSNENVPLAAAQSASAATNKPRPEPLNKESFSANEPIPAPAPPCSTSQTDQQHSDQVDLGDADAPPQTPHTADCISKIQAIQRDVLDLMCAVEQFGGKRGDKDYMYMDEMLTRNLLKLDTIDTNGKESIRLARREAIKCIQASIAVLEAKSDLHLNDKKDENNSALKENEDVPATGMETAETKLSTEKMEEAESTNATEVKSSDASAEIKGVENITIDDKSNAQELQSSPDAKPESETKLDNVDQAKQ